MIGKTISHYIILEKLQTIVGADPDYLGTSQQGLRSD
jgi:hypothetical protein